MTSIGWCACVRTNVRSRRYHTCWNGRLVSANTHTTHTVHSIVRREWSNNMVHCTQLTCFMNENGRSNWFMCVVVCVCRGALYSVVCTLFTLCSTTARTEQVHALFDLSFYLWPCHCDVNLVVCACYFRRAKKKCAARDVWLYRITHSNVCTAFFVVVANVILKTSWMGFHLVRGEKSDNNKQMQQGYSL